MDIAEVLAVFVARLAGGYSLCLALIGPRVTQGPWRKVSCFCIAGFCVVGIAAGLDWRPCIALAAACLLLERALAFGAPDIAPLGLIPFAIWLLWPLSVNGVASAAAIGGTLGAMLLGHSYLTARDLSFTPLKRMATLLFLVLLLRAAFVAPVFFGDRLPMGDWMFLTMRATMGLLMPIIFGWMVIRCVRIGSTQSATGILYAMTALVFIGELCAIYLQVDRGIAA